MVNVGVESCTIMFLGGHFLFTFQILLPGDVSFSHNARRHRQTDRQTDRQTTVSCRSYCMVVQFTKIKRILPETFPINGALYLTCNILFNGVVKFTFTATVCRDNAKIPLNEDV